MCSRTGSFPPSLARYFIWKFSKPGDKVLDPFSGKGTTPLEACIAGRIGIGNDIAPEAYVLTHSKVKPVALPIIKRYLASLKKKISYEDFNSSDVNWKIKIFFCNETLRQILALRDFLNKQNSDEAIFIKALMCGIIHGDSDISLSLPCSHSFSMSPKYVRRYAKKHGLKKPKIDVIACLEKKAERALLNPLPKVRGEAYQTDARKIPLGNESIDLIITSPPYLDKQTYAWDNWLRLWFLGHDYKTIAKKLIQTGSIEKYVQILTECLGEMYRVLKNNSACFIVVGDVNVRGKKVRTAELLIEPAEMAGFKVKRVIADAVAHEDKYFLFVQKNHGIKVDRILVLYKGKPKNTFSKINWDIAPLYS
jgi:site-specific DNA-methyltransferase (adenine-specific)